MLILKEYQELILACYKLASQCIDFIRNTHLQYEDRIFLSKKTNLLCNEAFRFCYKQYQKNKNLTDFNWAFYFAEKSKAAVLHTALAEQSAKQFAQIPDSLLKLEENLKLDWSYYQSRKLQEQTKGEKANQARLQNANEQLFKIQLQKQELSELFKSQYPKYFQLKNSQEVLQVERIQSELPKNTTLVEYYKLDTAWFAFVVTEQKSEIIPLTVSANISEQITSMLKVLETSDVKTYSTLAYQLYQQLYEPLAIEKEHVIIIPADDLWHLNYDVLLSSHGQSDSFEDLPYLIKKHQFSYHYSTELLLKSLNEPSSSTSLKCLAFSYTLADQSSVGEVVTIRGNSKEIQDLPGTRKEIGVIAEILEGAYYFGNKASERNFKQEANKYNILHLALHGQLNQAKPMQSRLVFSQFADSLEDNYLYAYELYNTELNAELAVLSACNTGTGQLVSGEGVISLGRAFSYAGCKSLLISQWELSDVFTPAIMHEFYSQLKAGKPKSEALRMAKLKHLKDADNLSANPYHWAALVQLGNDTPLGHSTSWYWWGVGIVLCSLIGGVLYKKKRV